MGLYSHRDYAFVFESWPGARKYLYDWELRRIVGREWCCCTLLQRLLIGLRNMRDWCWAMHDELTFISYPTPKERVFALLYYGLAGFAVFLENSVPRSVLKKGKGTLRIEWNGNDGTGYWELEISDAPDPILSSMRNLARDGFALDCVNGQPAAIVRDRLADSLIADLRSGKAAPPRFRRSDRSTLDVTYWEWERS